jgi:hypothetical protein
LTNDRLIRGALAGMISALSLLPWNLISYYLLNFAKHTWLELVFLLPMGSSPQGVMDYVASVVIFIIWNGFLGAIFVQNVMPDKEGCYIARSIGFSYICWFIFYSIGTLYRIGQLHAIEWQTALSNWIAVFIFGILLGWLTKCWDEKHAES